MKKILTLAIAFAVLQFSATAQTQRSNTGGMKSKNATMHQKNNFQNVEGLNLTDIQKKQITAIKEDSKAKAKALKSSSASEEDKKKQMKELRNSGKSKVAAILTPSQKDILKEKRAEAKKNHKIDGEKRSMKEGKMSRERKDKMKEKFENMPAETRAKLKAIRANEILTKEQKKEAVRKIMMENKSGKNNIRKKKS